MTALHPALPRALLAQVDRYWAELIECELAHLYSPLPVIIHRESAPDLIALKAAGAWVLSLSSQMSHQVDTSDLLALLEGLPEDGSEDQQLASFFEDRGLYGSYGPARLHYTTPDFFQPAAPVPFRRLVAGDEEHLVRFAEAMGGRLDYRLNDPRFPYMIGSFSEGMLAGVGTVQVWGGLLAETYGDTRPEHRGRGIGNGLVSELTRWVLEDTDYIAQEDGLRANTASMRIAGRLGYVSYGTLVMTNLSLSVDEPAGMVQSAPH